MSPGLSARTLAARLRARFERARRGGVVATARELAAKAAVAAGAIVLLPIALVLHVAGYRRVTFLTGRIGHLAAEPDSFLKSRALGELPERRWFFTAPRGSVANEHLLAYWSRHIPVVRHPVACAILKALSGLGLMRFNAGRYVLWLDRSQEIFRINARWAGRAPLLSVDEEDLRWSDEMLESLGIPRGAWFVCVHAREGGFSPQDEATHAHRNASIEALVPAMREIVRRGGWCVRVGDSTTRPLEPAEGVIDYAHHRLRQARLDVLLCARARFFLGNSSGIALVSSAFGVPSALANMVPVSALGVMSFDLSIPKLYRRRDDGRVLRFDEIFGTPAANFRFAHQYVRAGIDVVENTADEILELVVEMFDRIEGRRGAAPDEESLQRPFMSLMRSGDYGYGAASRVGAGFLRRHANLLRPD